jgi:hypothetical protein
MTMNLGPVVDVAIGMVFVYFLLALIASGIQELVAGLFTWRGTYLRRALDVILSNETDAGFGWNIHDFICAHMTWNAPDLKPSGSEQPGLTDTQRAVLAKVQQMPKHPILSGVPNKLPSYIPSRNFAKALLEVLRDGSDSPVFEQVQQTIDKLPDGDLKKTLTLFMHDAGGNLDAFRRNVEQWFDDAMDRVNGIYSRLSQYFLLIVGLLMAVVLNINSCDIATALWRSPALTQSIVAQATQLATTALSEPCPQAMGGTGKVDATEKSAACTNADKVIADNYARTQSLQIPMGWSKAPNGWSEWFACVFGMVITASAIGLGAPFWFGLLQNLTNFRNAGPVPKRADAKSP